MNRKSTDRLLLDAISAASRIVDGKDDLDDPVILAEAFLELDERMRARKPTPRAWREKDWR